MKYALLTLIIIGLVITRSHAEAKESSSPTNISKLVKKCTTCHGKDLKGKRKAPSIYGENFSILYVSLTSSIPKKMKKVASRLSREQAEEISRYISDLGETGEEQLD